MRDFERELIAELTEIRARGLLRELRRIDSPQSSRIQWKGQELLNFSSNDYLGLANDPRLKAAAVAAMERYGAGSGAARLISGSLGPHHDLEIALAAFKRTEAALVFSTGYATALGVIPALLGKDDVIILDRLVHASMVDAARLSGAKLRVFAHNDLDELQRILAWANQRSTLPTASRRQRILIVTESVFSMDGDLAPLREIVDLKEQYGAWLMLDEAHSTGLYGRAGAGLAQAAGVSERVEVQMGTLGKALGASGGFICGSSALIQLLVNRARSFIFSTAPMPACAAAAQAAVQIVQSAEGDQRREQLWQRVGQFVGLVRIAPASGAPPPVSAIVPVLIGDERPALEAAARLHAQGLFVPAIRYPTVRRGQARLRFTLTSAHTPQDVEQASKALAAVRPARAP